jgi:glutathionylspermidine synthase
MKYGVLLEEAGGEYGEEGFIYQELVEIEPYDEMYPVLGSWVIGGESCGIGIRETFSRITNNMSYFVPHVIE